jgi:hypothetical protein
MAGRADRHHRRLPRERAIVEGSAPGCKGPRFGNRSQAGHGRRGPRLLEGPASGLSHHARATLLGAQDGQRPRKLPKRLQPEAKEKLHQIWMAETRDDAEQAFDLFLETYKAKYPKATECLAKDRTVLLTFYDFPAEHWIHLRTTNPNVRHRPAATSANQGQRLPRGVPDHGLQTDAIRVQEMAAPKRLPALARRDRRSSIHRRTQTPHRRRLIPAHPQDLTIAPENTATFVPLDSPARP